MGRGDEMNWTRTDLQRSYVCNREVLKCFRERKTWSQRQLADESGVSVRVITKAEAGQSIATSSIARLADALKTENQVVFPEDLISFPIDVCKSFLTALHVHKHRMTDVISDYVEEDVTFCITGEPAKIPFAGMHRGLRAYRRALKKFFQIFEYDPAFNHSQAYEYFPNGTDVVLWGVVRVRLIDGNGEIESLPHRQRFRFRRGLLYSFEDQYDLEKGQRFVTDAVAIHGSKVYDPLEDSQFDKEDEKK